MSIAWSEALVQLDRRASQVTSLIDRYANLHSDLGDELQTVEAHLKQARLALATAYLPALVQTAVDRAERLTGFRGFSRHSPFKAMEQRRTTLEKTVQRIQQDERYQRRVGLIGPGGELTEKLKEIKDMGAPSEADCERFESQPLFAELLEAGYDTPEFKLSWWQGDYWKMWAAGDRICAALGLNDFGDDVRPAYEKAVKERTFWRDEAVRITGLIADVRRLVEEHDRAVATLPRLAEVILEECWGVLAEFFSQADAALLDAWLRKEPPEDADYTRPIEMALKRAAGLAAKRAYLVELRTGVDGLVGDLRQRRLRLQQRHAKLQTSSKLRHRPVMPSYIDAGFEPKRVKLEAQIGKLRHVTEKLIKNDKFDRFELTNDPSLWWMHFTGGPPPRLMPKLRTWYDRHPQAAVRTSQKEAKTVRDEGLSAQAVGTLVTESPSAAADGPGGYLS